MSRRLKLRRMPLCEVQLCQLDREIEEAGKLSWLLEINTSVGLEPWISLEFLPSLLEFLPFVLPSLPLTVCQYKKSLVHELTEAKISLYFKAKKLGLGSQVRLGFAIGN